MKIRFLSLFCLGLAISAAAQDATPAPQAPMQGRGGGQDQRGGRGDWMRGSRGVVGTVTDAAKDHYTVKSELGDVYTVFFSVNTRIMKRPAGRRRPGGNENTSNEAPTPPEPVKSTDIKVGDVIAADGDINTEAKTVGAVVIFQIDPERAKQMREMEANYGKTWLMGRVTAINELKITLQGGPDKVAHAFVADENTSFRKRRDPVTLADVQVGDMVRVEGAVKDGAFLATTVAVMGAPPDGTPRGYEPAASPQ